MLSVLFVSCVCSMFSVGRGLRGSRTSALDPEPCLAPSPEQQEQELTVALGQPVAVMLWAGWC